MKCLGCGVEKDLDKKEVYPYAEEGIVQDEAIDSLLVLDCQGPKIQNHPEGHSEYRTVVVCHSCFHRLAPDMWISEACWRGISPVVPYEELPLLTLDTAGDRWNPKHYRHPQP